MLLNVVLLPCTGHEDDSNVDHTSPLSGSSGEEERNNWYESTEGLAGIQRVLEEKEDCKDWQLERQLVTHERFASGYIGALASIAESLHTLVDQAPMLLAGHQ